MPVPAADPVLAEVADSHPHAVRPGLPAHVSLLYPFLDASRIDVTTLEWLRALAAAQPPVELSFDEVGREPGFVYLDASQLGALAEQVWGRWPEILPYGGQFGPRPGAHVTVAMGISEDEADSIAERAAKLLPMTGVVDRFWLVGFDQGWGLREEFRLTGS